MMMKKILCTSNSPKLQGHLLNGTRMAGNHLFKSHLISGKKNKHPLGRLAQVVYLVVNHQDLKFKLPVKNHQESSTSNSSRKKGNKDKTNKKKQGWSTKGSKRMRIFYALSSL